MADEVDLMKALASVNWTAVFTAAVTGLTAFFGNVWLARRQAKREQEGVRAALLAEVKALMDVVERRGYLQGFRETQRRLESMEQYELDALGRDGGIWYRVSIPDHYSRVYQENVSRLGCLRPSEAERVVRFYQLCDSVRADVTEGGALYAGTVEAEAFKESADMLESAMEIGHSLTG